MAISNRCASSRSSSLMVPVPAASTIAIRALTAANCDFASSLALPPATALPKARQPASICSIFEDATDSLRSRKLASGTKLAEPGLEAGYRNQRRFVGTGNGPGRIAVELAYPGADSRP
ncbi:hypothetical protein [Nocardia sp. NPDC059239]|uniref:hypothetical protein n=1 Tax=unclassified Nocardia TaxID=2637762 RepID=UPI00367E1AAF